MYDFFQQKTNIFQYRALLKIPFSSRSMKEFGLDIQKQIILKQFKTYFSKINKNTVKNAGFKGNFKYKEVDCFTGYLF